MLLNTISSFLVGASLEMKVCKGRQATTARLSVHFQTANNSLGCMAEDFNKNRHKELEEGKTYKWTLACQNQTWLRHGVYVRLKHDGSKPSPDVCISEIVVTGTAGLKIYQRKNLDLWIKSTWSKKNHLGMYE
jgi:hypothetical protein